MAKKNDKLSYKEAISKLRDIVESIESQELDIDILAAQVKEANSLIQICSEKLNLVNAEVEKLLTDKKD